MASEGSKVYKEADGNSEQEKPDSRSPGSEHSIEIWLTYGISEGLRGIVIIFKVETSTRRVQSVRVVSKNLPTAFHRNIKKSVE